MQAINIKDLEKKYGDLFAVKDLNLQIKEGEIFGFVGKNGAGKSTTIRTILNIIYPTKGETKVFDLNSITKSKDIKQLVSYVASEINFPNDINCQTLINLTAQFYDFDNTKIKELTDHFELDINKQISKLSLGNKKKVLVILALLRNPKLYILDEPTNGLDPYMQKLFFDILLKEKQKGKTIFLSSHNLHEIEKYCDRVGFIKDGQLIDIIDIKERIDQQKKIITYKLSDNTIHNTIYNDKDYNKLLLELSKKDVIDIEIKNSTLEDEFMHYYQGEQ